MRLSDIPTYDDIFCRNRGIIRNQRALSEANILIAGCGAEGGSAAFALTRMGIGGLILAEPDSFDVSNLNRQHGSTLDTIGLNKAEVISENVKIINPYCKVKVYSDGISNTNIDEMLAGVNVIVDAVDYFKPELTIMLYRKAREYKIPVITAVSVAWGSYLFYFEPDGVTFEDYIGLSPGASAESIKNYSYPLLSFCPEPPLYLGRELLQGAISGIIDIPVVAPAVNFTGGLISSFVYFLLSGDKKVLPVPYYYKVNDLFTLKPTKVSFIKKLLVKFFS